MTTSKSTTTFCRENTSVVKFSIRYFTIWKTCGISELNEILVEPEIKYPKANFDTIGKFFFFFFLYFDMVKSLLMTYWVNSFMLHWSYWVSQSHFYLNFHMQWSLVISYLIQNTQIGLSFIALHFMLGTYNLVIKGFITRVLNGWSGVIVR